MKKILFPLLAFVSFSSLMGQPEMEKVVYLSHLYVKSDINGKKALLAFDTGSPYTCVDSTYVADSNLQYTRIGRASMGGAGNAQEKVRIIIGELTYTFADKKYTSRVSPIIQLKPILGDQADGILGIDNMGDKVIAIDYEREQMGLWDQLGDVSGYTSIPIRYENNRIYVPLSVTVGEGEVIEGEGLIDLGSGGSIEFTSMVAQQYNLKGVTPQLPYSYAVGGIGGESSGCYIRVKSASVGDYTLNDIVISFSNNTGGALSDREYICIVGNDFWERFDMMIDLSGRRLYLRPNARFGEPFESPVRGFSYTDRSRTLGCWVVNCLYEGSNAEKAGLRKGDLITALNGRNVKEITLEERKTLFDGMKKVCLTVWRDNGETEIAFPFDEPKL